MKKYIKYLLYSLVAVTLFAAWGCSDDNDQKKEQEIALNQLPQTAQGVIGQNFAGDNVLRVVTDIDDGQKTYEVYLESGMKIEFDASGNWTDIEAPYGGSVPSTIIPDRINTYLATNYPGVGVHEISVVWEGYEVELNNGVELVFDSAGVILGNEPNVLPPAALDFIETHFNSDPVANMTYDYDNGTPEYNVVLSSGTKIEFDASGNWTDIEAPLGGSVPTAVIPQAINTYLAANYPNIGVHEISVDRQGYDVELNNGIDLNFDSAGNFLRID